MGLLRVLILLLAAVLISGGLASAAERPEVPSETKLETDAALRSGMLAIRDLVRLNHSLITHRRMPPDHARRFAKAVKAEADQILATSTVGGAAKARLTALLDEIVSGINAVAHPERGVAPIDGLVRADEALARYPLQFEHPGWAPVQSLD